MDVKFINPFLYGTIEVLKKMAFIEPRPGKVYLKKNDLAYGDVSGIIGITGDMIGSLAISFGESCICHLLSSMLGESFAEANQDVFDGVGELTNMISGVARTNLEKEGLHVYAAIPSVVYGKNHTINHILNSPSIVIPFVTDEGTFVVDVCIKKSDEKSQQWGEHRIVNQKTPVGPPSYEIRQSPSKTPVEPTSSEKKQSPPKVSQPANWTDKKEMIMKKLREVNAIRDDMLKQLSENPFMDINKRRSLRQRIPMLEAQLRRLRLDLSTAEMLANMNPDDLEHPEPKKHYQHYESNKPKS